MINRIVSEKLINYITDELKHLATNKKDKRVLDLCTDIIYDDFASWLSIAFDLTVREYQYELLIEFKTQLMINDNDSIWFECFTLEEIKEGLIEALTGYQEYEATYQLYDGMLQKINRLEALLSN